MARAREGGHEREGARGRAQERRRKREGARARESRASRRAMTWQGRVENVHIEGKKKVSREKKGRGE